MGDRRERWRIVERRVGWRVGERAGRMGVGLGFLGDRGKSAETVQRKKKGNVQGRDKFAFLPGTSVLDS